ncbi:Dyp-type peroxidase [Leekyejoonella antrihumi]|uniref:Dyp-type peroxidase n=1 Tax=Leekyejoonella antrihumi TaxID=1660198 RepID=A0A563E1T6_9MICO|nr:Dyp-type peroxidase [Leekyejoonella antrihumi]TWP36486.1 Dyp-type peroxidase [Leekyejoonella antrihumi]
MTDNLDPQQQAGLDRRRLLQGAAGGLLAGGALAGAATAYASSSSHSSSDAARSDKDTVDLSRTHPFYDQPHPAGISTPPQRHALFMTFDLVDRATRSDLQVLLARWSAAIAQLAKGRTIGAVQPARAGAVGADTGEAAGLDPAGLTVTVGLGSSIFDKRFGLEHRRPALLEELPDLPSDQIQPSLSGGDLSVQACADDPQVAYHAVRNLARMVRGTAETGWTVMGFGRASAGPGQETPRNLMGFKDGTRNISTPDDYDHFVWVTDDGWMSGGTYQVVRKIQMNLEIWDADDIADQQNIFGRTKSAGAPLTGHREMDTPDFHATGKDGKPAIPGTAHIALAAHENNGGTKILRRAYNYTDGINKYGQLDAGLLMIIYANDPDHFVKIQRRLGASDRLNEYIQHIGSGLWAIPPAPRSGHFIAEDLFI